MTQQPITVDQIRHLVSRPDQVLVSDTAKTTYRVLPGREWYADRMPSLWAVTSTQIALAGLTDQINAEWLTRPGAPQRTTAPVAHRSITVVIESNHAGLTMLVGHDVHRLVLAIVEHLRAAYGARLNADEGPHFLADHPYPASDDPADAANWLTALAELVPDPLIHYFREGDICLI